MNSDPDPQPSLAGCSSTSETTTLPPAVGDLPDYIPPTAPSIFSSCTASVTAAPVTCATLPITDPHAASATSTALPNTNIPAAMFSGPPMSNVSLQHLLLLQAIQERHEQLQSQLLSGQTKEPENGRSELQGTDHCLSTTVGLDGNESPPPDNDSDVDQEGEPNQVCDVKHTVWSSDY
jgi:hypothetical protein